MASMIIAIHTLLLPAQAFKRVKRVIAPIVEGKTGRN
ncbi:predicted protein [Sclerotinia sclerotiorum 1980 UF-70]|uniref:Uncharacterized protein n=1 Tax=Sclerotinia sclerotiorum (strain ATCC 18683 / 1980 / Ss-1) TaxID=665079 RepID=A7EBY5_SCLS1|nr:predicted protein [Sclerotinia sclerotiorum 1980 UF-70]EDN99963.1 predicted protein [Sclerotinia sclerotiorum 1980 UF-70]